MTITTRLKINAGVSAAMVLLVCLFFVLAFLRQQDVRERAAVANELMKGTFELTILSNTYLRHPEERPKEQWLLRHGVLVRALDTLSIRPHGQQVLLDRLGQNLRDMRILFDRLVASQHAPATGPAGSAASGVLAVQLRDQLSELMLKRSREISLDATRLAATGNRQIEAISRNILISIPAVALVVVVITLWSSALIARSITGPIRRLRAGTEVIGSGRLDHRIGLTGRDEIALLSQAFDRMAENLKTTTVSRDELAHEIRERARIEEELRRAKEDLESRVRERTVQLQATVEELKRSNQELEQFAYVSSHDLQEPLRMVASYVGLLGHRYRGKLDAKADQYIAYAEEGAQRMHTLILDLLEYSRVRTRAQPLGPVDGEKVLAHALQNLAVAVEETGARITHDPLPTVLADESQLTQVFQNLIGNALKFRKKDHPPEVHVSAEKTDCAWRFAVRDHGIGIAPEHLEKIFVIFQRLHTRRHYEGNGIGLAVVKRIVERHGGQVWVESTPGDGSTFLFTLPVASILEKHVT